MDQTKYNNFLENYFPLPVCNFSACRHGVHIGAQLKSKLKNEHLLCGGRYEQQMLCKLDV